MVIGWLVGWLVGRWCLIHLIVGWIGWHAICRPIGVVAIIGLLGVVVLLVLAVPSRVVDVSRFHGQMLVWPQVVVWLADAT
jgi:hypothetical protein